MPQEFLLSPLKMDYCNCLKFICGHIAQISNLGKQYEAVL